MVVVPAHRTAPKNRVAGPPEQKKVASDSGIKKPKKRLLGGRILPKLQLLQADMVLDGPLWY